MSTTNSYRADIDGLRALAVLSVTIFHLRASWMPNGFLGVDIFFVLSGFLITTILYREITTDTFSFARFYIRRIRRILPAFFVVVFVALGLGLLLFQYGDLYALKKSAIASVAFLANIEFARQGGYFDVSAEEKPLLHIWSLSVEEQFYFVFPLILIFCIKMLKGGGMSKLKLRLNLVLSLFALVSFALSFVPIVVFGWELEAYYLPHLRFGELLIGSILAIALIDRPHTEDKPYIPWMGSIAFIVIILCLFPKDTFVSPWFPGVLAAVPCLAVAALIYCNRQDYWLSRLFSTAPIVWVGKISYSLYLWHWVVLAFIRCYTGTDIPLSYLAWATPLIFVLASLSYYLIEQPLRHRNFSLKKGLLLYYLLPAAVVVGGFFYYPKEYPIPSEYLRYSRSEMCFDTVEGDCRKGDLSQPTQVLVAGDSHTGHLVKFFDEMGKREGWCAFVSAAASCPFFFDYDFKFRGQQEGFCEYRNNFLSEEYKKFPVIMISVYWGSRYYKGDSTFIPHLDYTVGRLLAEGKKVYLINSHYQRTTTRQRETYLVLRGLLKPDPDRMSIEHIQGDVYGPCKSNAEAIREHIKGKYPEAIWVDLTSYVPQTLLYEGMPVLADPNHLNDYGAKIVASEYAKRGRLIPQSFLK